MIPFRKYGTVPYKLAVLHGGPGAPGEMAPVARKLVKAMSIGAIEPLQSRNTVDGQIQELKLIIEKNAQPPITLIGWSWGAWLGFIFAAKNPMLVKKLILIGACPFKKHFAKNIMSTRLKRFSPIERTEAIDLIQRLEDPAIDTTEKDDLFGRLGELLYRVDSYEPMPYKSKALKFQYQIFHDVWSQASELRLSGKLLEFGKSIRCPVVAIHGDYDPHPFAGVKEPLENVLSEFRFILLPNCGHQPWSERGAVDEFYKTLEREAKS